VDLNRGTIAWQVPVGEGSQAIRTHPMLKGVKLPERLGSPANGGAILTGGGLIFIGGGDGHFYALDRNNGREVWRTRLPYVNVENTMTYRTRAGQQFVLVSTGAGTNAALVAFALDAVSRQSSAPPPVAATATASRDDGQAAFDRVCSVCHGPEARGDAAPRLVPFSREADELRATIREGMGQMPPIPAQELTDQEVVALVEYLKSLSR
jgi:mono/diheme cytochrome c family protein